MDALREFLKGWVGKGLLILFLLPLAITGFESIVRQNDDPNAVAKVGEQNISSAVLQNMVKQRRDSLLQAVNNDASLINQNKLQEQVLDSLIDRYLLLQQAKKLGFSISDTTLTQMLATDPNFQQDGKFSNDLFANYLRSQGMNTEQLFDILRNDQIVPEFSRSILNTGIFTNTGVEKFINMQTENRPIWVARLNWQSASQDVQISDTDITTYYNTHKDKLISDEMVDISYLTLDKNSLKIDAPTEQEIQAQYQTYLKNTGNETSYDLAMILVSGDKAQTTLADVKKQFDEKKADFASLAKQYSEDEGSKNGGGHIGTLNKSLFPNDFDKILNAVKDLKEGEITAPIQTNYGYHLFQLVKANGKTAPSLESVKDTLIEQIISQKREAMYQDIISKINNDAVSGANINEIANRYHLTVNTLKDYPKTNNKTVLNQPAIINTAFDETLIQDNSLSVGVELANGMVWVQSNNHRPSKNMSQAEATNLIKERLTIEKSKDIALQQAQNIAKEIQTTKDFDKLGIKFESLGMVNRLSPLLLNEERGVAFSTPASDDKLAVSTQKTEQGVSIIVGGKIVSDNAQITDDIRKQTANMLKDNIAQSQFEDYLAYLRSIYDVTINQDNLTTP